MLFVSLNYPIVLLLFLYLGLISGLAYFITVKFSSLICKKIFVKQEFYTEQYKILTSTQKNTQQKVLKNNKNNNNNKKQLKHNHFNFKVFLKLAVIICKKVFLYYSKFFLKYLNIIVLVCFSILTFLINLKFNFGYMRVAFVVVWLFSFFLSKRVLKLLANFMLNFYNLLKGKLRNAKSK